MTSSKQPYGRSRRARERSFAQMLEHVDHEKGFSYSLDDPALSDAARTWNALRGHPVLADIAAREQSERTGNLATRLSAAWTRFATPTFLFASGGIAAAILLAVLLVGAPAGSDITAIGTEVPTYSTTPGVTREIELPDGSSMILGAESSVDVAFSREVRLVTLLAGEAFFDVARDESRPFTVRTGNAYVSVLGTRFNVNARKLETEVQVEEGRVKVKAIQATQEDNEQARDSAGAAHTRVIVTGQQITASGNGFESDIVPIRSQQVGAWQYGRLVYFDEALGNVVSDASRYRAGEIIVADPEVKRIRVTAAFSTDQIDEMLAMLESSFGLVAEPQPGGDLLLRRRHQVH